MSEFKREERYIVIKMKDLAALRGDIAPALIAFMECWDIPTRAALVIEKDWPEFEPTWAAIKARMAGQPSAAEQAEAKSNQHKLAIDAACGEIALLKEELENYQLSASHQVVKGIVEAAVGDTVNMLLGAVKASEACGGPVWVITATQDGVMRKRVISPFEWSEDSRSMYEWAEGMEVSQTKIFPDAAEVSQ